MAMDDERSEVREARLGHCIMAEVSMTTTERSEDGRDGARFRSGCGPACPYRDWINGGCERHGPTESDLIIERMTRAFKRDLQSILRSDR